METGSVPAFARSHLGGHEGPPLLHMNRVGLHQPHVPVDPRSLIKPAIAGSGVHANQQGVPAAGVREFGHVKAERIVSTAVAPNVKAVEDHHRFPVRAIELQGDALIRVGGGKLEDAAIPAYARRRVGPPQGVEALALQRGVVLERQLDRPIVGQIHAPPVAIVVRNVPGGKKISRLLEVARPATAEAEVFGRVVGVPEVEAPAEIQQQTFASSA